MRRVTLILTFCFSWLTSAHADVVSVRAYDPRPFGYFVGDVIERSFEIETAAGDALAPGALPRPGAVNYWLELRSVETSTSTRENNTIHRVKLVYQTFYAPLDPRKLSIPSLPLTVRTASGTERATLPAFTFIASPIREIFPEKSGETAETFLRPEPEPLLVPTGRLKTWLAVSGAVSVILLTLLARHLAWWPFNRRPARPFSRAARDVAHVLHGQAGADAYAEALLVLHRAIDESAGRRVLASDAERFLLQRPEHRESTRGVLEFFEASRAAFFSGDRALAQRILGASALVDLSARLAREERGQR